MNKGTMDTRNLTSKEMLMRSIVVTGMIERAYDQDYIMILNTRQLSYKRSITSMQQEFQEQIEDNYEQLGGNGFKKSDDRTRMWLIHSISSDEHRRAELLDCELPLKKTELKTKKLHALVDLYSHSANGLSDDIIENDFIEILRIIIDETVYVLECEKKSAQYLRNMAANQVQLDNLYLSYAMTEAERKEKGNNVTKSMEHLKECEAQYQSKRTNIEELKQVLRNDVLEKFKTMDFRKVAEDDTIDIFYELYSQFLMKPHDNTMQDFTR